MTDISSDTTNHGSSPASRGGAGAYIEGELGAYYLLSLLADIEPRGLPGARAHTVRFQGVEEGFSLDDLVIHGASEAGQVLLEIQSKRTITFSAGDRAFRDVCKQMAKASAEDVPQDRHRLAVATQRTSAAISGPYQDVLEWARKAAKARAFFDRVATPGVAGPAMGKFASTFRTNLVAAGIPDEDDAVWQLMKRFLILEFDFESSAPQARTHALFVARNILAPQEVERAESLWSNLIELSLERAKSGGFFRRDELREILVDRRFRFAGDRDLTVPRRRLAEHAKHALAEIGTTVAGVQLPRPNAVEALDRALDDHRFIQLRGGPGVGKSAVMKAVAERLAGQAPILVLDPVSTPEGGWAAFAQAIGLDATAREFLADLAASGGAVVFIDGLDMFTSVGRRRTINDLLREAAALDGLSVVATVRSDFANEGDNWIAPQVAVALGPMHAVDVPELDSDELETLRTQAPELRALLAPDHPAAAITRNLYRLSKLLKVASPTTIRSETALAAHWWETADSAEPPDKRAAQRIMAELADAALDGESEVACVDDSPARAHLLRSQTVLEAKRDRLRFYHDVLRDWAVAARLHEDVDRCAELGLKVPVSGKVARGIEFAGRFALELTPDTSRWLHLLKSLAPAEAHSSWRRHALLAIVRSELSVDLLERSSPALLADDGALLRELCIAVTAVETTSAADVIRQGTADSPLSPSQIPPTVRVASTAAAFRLANWCVRHADDVPFPAIGDVVKLVQCLHFVLANVPAFAAPVTRMLFGWLRQVDEPNTAIRIPSATALHLFDRRSIIEDLRMASLLLSSHAPVEARAYLSAMASDKSGTALEKVRPFSSILASVAPQELADLVVSNLMEHRRGRAGSQRNQAFGFGDSHFLPTSPAQKPFLDLLTLAPDVGLNLVRRLVDEAVAFHFGTSDPSGSGMVLALGAGERRFPWEEAYFWSRGQGSDYAVASALMALEAWGHDRIEAGVPLGDVIEDVLGPDGGCAAYLLVAVDLLLSHWPDSRALLVPFVGSPELLAIDRGRAGRERFGIGDFGREPTGRVRRADLHNKPSRKISLEDALRGYLGDDAEADRVRTILRDALNNLPPYGDRADFGDPAFMGSYALNVLDRKNWFAVGDLLQYQSPPTEAAHLARLTDHYRDHQRQFEVESNVMLAVRDSTRGSSGLAAAAADMANGDLPDGSDADVLLSRSTRLAATAMLVARDGDAALLAKHDQWIRESIRTAFADSSDSSASGGASLEFNHRALALLALIHLWLRNQREEDRDDLVHRAACSDRSAFLAFSAAADLVIRRDARLLKAVARTAFATSTTRRAAWDEDEATTARHTLLELERRRLFAEAEVAWLNGAAEPSWPELRTDDEPTGATADSPNGFHVNTQRLAEWLRLLVSSVAPPEWRVELVDAYMTWSARVNGLGHPLDADVDRPMEWNDVFYSVVARAAIEARAERFDEMMAQVVALPDASFGDVAEALLHAADFYYFGDVATPPSRVVDLRARLVARTVTFRGWTSEVRPGNLSTDRDIAGVVAKLLWNTHRSFGAPTTSDVDKSTFDRLEPLLDVVRPIMIAGPTPLIALCMMNTLLVDPRGTQLDFLLFAAACWLKRVPNDSAMWIELGIGTKLIDWLNTLGCDDASIFSPGHPMRGRLDSVVGHLVRLGVPGSYEFELRVGQER